MLTREATVGQGSGAKKPALAPLRLLLAAMAVARHEDGEAVLGVAVRLQLRRLGLEPADGPVRVVRVGPRQAPAAVGRHDDHVVLPVDPRLPAAAAPVPGPPWPRAAAGGVERDGVGLPEPGGEVREGGACERRARELVGGHPGGGAPRPQPLREAAQRHGHGAKRKILASREKTGSGASRSDQKSRQNQPKFGVLLDLPGRKPKSTNSISDKNPIFLHE